MDTLILDPKRYERALEATVFRLGESHYRVEIEEGDYTSKRAVQTGPELICSCFDRQYNPTTVCKHQIAALQAASGVREAISDPAPSLAALHAALDDVPRSYETELLLTHPGATVEDHRRVAAIAAAWPDRPGTAKDDDRRRKRQGRIFTALARLPHGIPDPEIRTTLLEHGSAFIIEVVMASVPAAEARSYWPLLVERAGPRSALNRIHHPEHADLDLVRILAPQDMRVILSHPDAGPGVRQRAMSMIKDLEDRRRSRAR